MAITPAKPDRFDVTSKGKVRIWLAPTISAGGDTIAVPGMKEIWDVVITNRPATTFTYTTTGASNSVALLTITVTGSCTGPAIGTGATVLSIYGR